MSKEGWQFTYIQNSCIKAVDDKSRRLLLALPNTPYITRVWIPMSLVKFVSEVGNGFYRKLIFRGDMNFDGQELIEGNWHDLTISAQRVAHYCEPMNTHIKCCIRERQQAELNRRIKQDNQQRRY